MDDISNHISAGGDKPSVFAKIKTDNCHIPVYSNGTENDGLYGYTNNASIFDNAITISARGTIGFCCKRTNPYLPIVRLLSVVPSSLIDIDYLLIVLSSFTTIKEGSSIPQLTVPSISQLVIPIPPLNEQKIIAARVNNLLMIIRQIDFFSEELQTTVSIAKSKILELAMQGKLVPQDPADEPAADMLRRVNPKARIITDNPHSWNIPESWIWVRIKDIFNPMERSIPKGITFKYIDIDSIENKKNIAYPKEIQSKNAPSRASRKTSKGDVVFSMVRPYLRNIAVVPVDDCIASTGFYVFNPTSAIDNNFTFALALAPYFVDGLNSYMKGDNSPSINKNNVEDFIIGLPPLNEQKRIVAKIEELYAVLDEIEASLQP